MNIINYLRQGSSTFSMAGQGSPNNVRSVKAAPSAKDFKQYPPYKNCQFKRNCQAVSMMENLYLKNDSNFAMR